MASSDVERLRDLLDEALIRAEVLAQEPREEPEGAGYFDDPGGGVAEAVERIASHDGPIALFVGAGVSMEADLPPWGALVGRLLEDVAGDLEGDARREWVDLTLAEGPLAAAAVARSLRENDVEFRRALRRALYDGRQPQHFAPGALAMQIAWLKERLGSRLRLLTANFDGLLEAALREVGLEPVSYVRANPEPEGKAAVWHLHGRLMQNDAGSDWLRPGPLVLAEGDYVQSSYATWPQQYVADRLRDSMCVFVGLSMTDPNFIRWLYRYGAEAELEHTAIFVRQGAPVRDRAVRTKLEESAAARWRRSGVTPVWTNYYGEVAQMLHEAGLRMTDADVPHFGVRAAAWHGAAKRLLAPEDPDEFVDAQRDVSEWLRGRVHDIRKVADTHGVDLSEEDLGLGLWAVDHDRGVAELWATSAASMADRGVVEARPVHVGSRWIGVEAITRGISLEQDPAVYTSRWRFVRGIPVIVEDGEARGVVGAVTLTSTTPMGSCRLAADNAPPGLLREVDRFLGTSAGEFFVE
jgi:hypothetical protein